jgi:hypothetical protein
MSKVGRPKADHPRNFTLPAVRVNREENRMFKLKAGIYANGSLAKFSRMAMEAYREKIPETVEIAGRIGRLQFGSEVYSVKVGNEAYAVTVTNIPEYVMDDGEIVSDLMLRASIEEEVEQSVLECVQNRRPVPGTIDLLEWIGLPVTV